MAKIARAFFKAGSVAVVSCMPLFSSASKSESVTLSLDKISASNVTAAITSGKIFPCLLHVFFAYVDFDYGHDQDQDHGQGSTLRGTRAGLFSVNSQTKS